MFEARNPSVPSARPEIAQSVSAAENLRLTQRQRCRTIVGVLLALAWVPQLAAAADIYVAPEGMSTNLGTITSPLDLATALSADSPARPGDTIWVRGGTYPGEYVSALNGTAWAPVIVRNYDRERATIDTRNGWGAALTINGAYTWFWGLEIMSGGSLRRTPWAGSEELDRGMGVRNNGASTKLINNVIHDTALGVSNWGSWYSNPDLEAYGNLVYNNGWEQIPPGHPGRGHGHGFYTLSKINGNTKLRDNIVHTNFSQGIRMGDDGVFDPWIEGNISYLNGAHMWLFGNGRNIYVGGSNDNWGTTYVPMTGAVIRANYTYHREGTTPYAEGLNLGLWWPGASGEIVGNYFAGHSGGDALALGYFDHATVTACSGNTVFGSTTAYVQAQCPTGTNHYHSSTPTQNAVFVRPNQFEAGRAHIAIYNWQRLGSVVVDLSGAGLAAGQSFEIRDAM